MRALFRRSISRWIAALALGLFPPAHALGQPAAPLVGPAREVAREVLIDPVVFDPLIVSPLAATPQAVIDAHGADISGTLHAALQNGDDSYGILVSGPIARSGDTRTEIDPRGLRPYAALGVELTNIIWRPRATPALERQLTPDGFARLSPERRQRLAQSMAEDRLVDVPWVVFFHASYQFSRTAYDFAEPSTGQGRSQTHLNDTASLMTGAQVHVRPADPGYFFGASFIYSAVFHDASTISGAIVGPPAKVRGNLIRFEMRRPVVRAHVGINPSYSYDVTSHAKTIDAAAYAFVPRTALGALRFYGGVRAGYQTSPGGAFASVFVGTLFKRADPAASASRD